MESAWGARWWVGNIRRTSREARRAVPGRLARYCGCARSYICSGRGPAGFPEGPTGTAAPPRLVSSAGTGWRACSSSRPRSSVSRCCLWPVSSCTLTSCCCTASRSVFTSPRSCTKYACCAVSFSCTVRSNARTVSISLARWLSARARSTRSASTWSSTRRTSPFSAHPAVSPRTSTNGRACLNGCSGSRLLQVFAARQNLELIAAILRPRPLVVSGGERPLLAVGHGLDPTPIDAVADDVLLRRRGAAIAERQVILVRAALVAVPADADAQGRVSLEDRHLLVQDRGVPAPDDRLVIVEVDHGGKERLHRLRPTTHGSQRVGDLLTASRLCLGPPACFLLGRLHGIVVRLLGRAERVRVGPGRGRRRLRLLPAARGERYGDQTAQQEQG